VVKIKYALLTFDIEEFDMPLEFKQKISEEEIFERSLTGTKRILELVNKHNIRATFFVTPKFANKYPELIKEISNKHEIALHGYHEHSYNYRFIERDRALKELKKGKERLEKIIGKKINGFREPRMQKPPYSILKKIGFKYDSSLNPTFMPGRYNNLFAKRKPFFTEDIMIIPLSVTPVFRFPLFWFFFRNFGLNYGKFVTKCSLIDQEYVALVFHPWEFIDLNEFRIPYYFRRNCNVKIYQILDKYIKWCLDKKLKFISMGDYHEKNFNNNSI